MTNPSEARIIQHLEEKQSLVNHLNQNLGSVELSKATELLKKEISWLERLVHVQGHAYLSAMSKK